ncbi:MAG: riboflavin kinase [Tremellales sp. Tagirdzhanova-0007]|nr:MAG: riboflavin kinase [Tremellales sp. Tagirdzhanova-0007]
MAPISRENRPLLVGPSRPEPPFPLHLDGLVTPGFGRGARFLGIPTANLPDSSLAPLNDLHLTGIYYGFARVHSSLPKPLASGSRPSAYLNSPPASGSGTSTPTRDEDPLRNPLDSHTISSLPAETAPYPPGSVAGDNTGPKTLDDEDGRVWPMVMSVGWNPYFKNEKITAEVHIMHPFKHDFYGHEMSVLVLGYIRPELDYVSKDALVEDIRTDVKVAFNSLARAGYAECASNPFLLGGDGGNRR